MKTFFAGSIPKASMTPGDVSILEEDCHTCRVMVPAALQFWKKQGPNSALVQLRKRFPNDAYHQSGQQIVATNCVSRCLSVVRGTFLILTQADV